MVSLEQVKLLETRVAGAIEYVERLAGENATLRQREATLVQNEAALQQREAEMRAKLDSYQKRIDELEVLVTRFKEDQSRIEDGILSALDRLNQFEDAIEKSLNGGQSPATAAAGPGPKAPGKNTAGTRQTAPARTETPAAAEILSEIPEALAADTESAEPSGENDTGADGELDIF